MAEVLTAPLQSPSPNPPPAPARRGIARRIARSLLLLLGLLVVALAIGAIWVRSEVKASLPRLDGELKLAGLAGPVTIERDALGVPTIRAADRVDAARVLGFLHAQDRFFQMDLMRRSSAGELSALFGALAVDADKQIRVHRFRHRAGRVLAVASPEERRLLGAYAEGVNSGLAALGAKPWEYLALRTEPQPWAPEDSILTVFAMFADLQDEEGLYESDLGLIHDLLPKPMAELLTPVGTEWDAPVVGTPWVTPALPGPEVFDLRKEPKVDLPEAAAFLEDRERPSFSAEPSGERVVLGSNNWAVAGTHTRDGRALFANDMHLGLRVPNTWYRASLVRPDGAGGELRVTGVSLPGTPAVAAGSNGHVAWGFTNSYGDWSDLIILEVDPKNPEVYRTPGGPKRFEKVEEVIAVKGGDPVRLEVRETIWGPVINQDHLGRPRAYAWTAHRPEAVNADMVGLESVRTLEEAMTVANLAGVPAQNFVAADSTGRIGWTIFGRIPRRVGFDGRVPTSWADGSRRWEGWLTPEEAPRVIDPPAGRLWTANSRVVSGELLSKVGDGGYAFGARGQQIRDGLLAVDKATREDMLALQLDDRALYLDRWRQVLLGALTPEAVAANPQRRELRRVLEESWTGRASVDTIGYRLVRGWHDILKGQVLTPLTARCIRADERFDPFSHQSEGALWRLVTERPAHLLDPKFRTWDEQLLAAADRLFQPVDGREVPPLAERTWGRLNTSQIRHPLSGAIPFVGRWLDAPSRPMPGDRDMPRVQGPGFGASERLVVSPGREQDGFFHMPTGQSGHPMSPYYLAGHEAWVEGRPTPFLPGVAEHTLKLIP